MFRLKAVDLEKVYISNQTDSDMLVPTTSCYSKFTVHNVLGNCQNYVVAFISKFLECWGSASLVSKWDLKVLVLVNGYKWQEENGVNGDLGIQLWMHSMTLILKSCWIWQSLKECGYESPEVVITSNRTVQQIIFLWRMKFSLTPISKTEKFLWNGICKWL